MSKIFAATILFVASGLALAAPLREGAKNPWGTFEDPDKDCEFRADDGALTITVLGKDHDLGIERGKMNAPRAMQPIDGDFTIEVKVSGKFEPRQMNNNDRRAYNGAGFFLRKDDNNYIRLDRATFWDGMMNHVYANFEIRTDGQIERFGLATDLALDNAKDTWLKIERHGNDFKAFATQEAGKWHALGSKTMEAPTRIQAGIAAINTSLETFTPRFSDLELKPAPLRKGNASK
jgi:regulation of enolase protein 1 (concanavalin A-like superfamily)